MRTDANGTATVTALFYGTKHLDPGSKDKKMISHGE